MLVFQPKELNSVKVCIYTEYFDEWGGGIDFLRIVITGLLEVSDKYNLDIVVLVPIKKTAFLEDVKKWAKIFINKISAENKYHITDKTEKQSTLHHIFAEKMNLKMVFFEASNKNLIEELKKNKADVVIPVFNSLGSSFPFPWVGYIYDFQHKYFPHFFNKNDIESRNNNFNKMLSDADVIIVNSKAVKEDIYSFHSNFKSELVSLPFCPLYPSEEPTYNSSNKANIPKNYFMVSNQFWLHKDHKTAFIALAEYYKLEGNRNNHLVCTGSTHDHRDPNYFNNLLELIDSLGIKNEVHILGYIPKEEQLHLMLNAKAIIQATLFEGGPGGGAIYEAMAHGVPSIISNIKINQELFDEPNKLFFEAQNPIDLANKMLEVESFKKMGFSEMQETAKLKKNKLGEVLVGAINKAIVLHKLKSNAAIN